MLATIVLVVLLSLFAAPSANAGAGAIDKTFKAPVTHGRLTEMVVQPDGRILIAGTLRSVDGWNRYGVARIHADGRLDRSFVPPYIRGKVTALALQPDGKVLVGGTFLERPPNKSVPLLRLNADGSFDDSFVVQSVNANELNALTVLPDGEIFMAGWIHRAPRYGAIKFTSEGLVDETFTTNVGGIEVRALAVQPDGRIVVAGYFNSVHGVPTDRIARLMPDGALDTDFSSPGFKGGINAMVLQPDGRILLGGGFSRVGGQPRGGFARLLPDGQLDTSTVATSGIAKGVTVLSMALQPDGKVLLAGAWMAGKHEVDGIARVKPNGRRDPGFRPKSSFTKTVWSVALQSDGAVLVDGGFKDGKRVQPLRLRGDLRPPRLKLDSVKTNRPRPGGVLRVRFRVSNPGDVAINGAKVCLDEATLGRAFVLAGNGEPCRSIPDSLGPKAKTAELVYRFEVVSGKAKPGSRHRIGFRLNGNNGITGGRLLRRNQTIAVSVR